MRKYMKMPWLRWGAIVFCAQVATAWAGVADGVALFEKGQYKEARVELSPEAEKGDVQAQAYMGEMYLAGWGGGRDELKAREYITYAAEEGRVLRSVYQLGLMYLSGNLVAKDETKGVDLIQKAAQGGHAAAQTRLGIWLHRGQYGYAKDQAAALAWFKAAAQQKDAGGMNWLGHYHEQGLAGAAKDYLFALDSYRKAAELKNADASLSVGRIYLNGLGVQVDTREGLKWYRRAAVFGSSVAQLQLASFYEYGRAGLVKDPGLAIAWYSMALTPPSTPEAQIGARDALERLRKSLAADYVEQEKRGKLAFAQMVVQVLAEVGSNTAQTRRGVFGSGVLVSSKDEILTNEHVILSCDRIRLQPSGIEVKLIAKDGKNDLALLRAQTPTKLDVAHLRFGKGVRQGDEVVVVGYPLKGVLSSGPVVTNGIVNGLSGVSNDSTNFQISATVQPGSSGGGIWDRDGLLVGLVRARLLSNTEINAQNVNFGIQLASVLAFLDNNGVDYQGKPTAGGKLSLSAVSRQVGKSTVQVECY